MRMKQYQSGPILLDVKEANWNSNSTGRKGSYIIGIAPKLYPMGEKRLKMAHVEKFSVFEFLKKPFGYLLRRDRRICCGGTAGSS